MNRLDTSSAERRHLLTGGLVAAFSAFAISTVGIVMVLAALSSDGNGLPAAMTLSGLAVWLVLSIISAILIAGRSVQPEKARIPVSRPIHEG